MKIEPMQHLRFDPLHSPLEKQQFRYDVARIAAQVADLTDKAIVEAMIAAARNEGLTDLYLIDRQFLFDAIKEKVEREKNTPLTMDELLKLDEAPVYVVDTVTGQDSQWCIVSVSEHFPGEGAAYPGGSECFWFEFKNYGTTWLAYHRKPEEA